MTRRLAVVGNGIAAAAMLDWLVRLEAGWDITVFGDEPHPAYDRAALSGVLSGERSAGDLWLHGEDWYRQHGIEVRAGCRVLGLATATNTLRTERGDVGFDACVLATGSRPVVPPIGGAELSGVTTFRTLDHVRRLVRAPAGRAVVIGGGLLGLEAARGLLARGHRVTVVHLMDRLMERQLDHGAAGFLRRELERIGIRVLLGARTERIEGWRRAESVVLAGGARLPADLVVICAGVSPDLDLAAAAGLKVCRGILVDDRLATSAPGVFAVGECAEHRGVVHGLVAPVREQALALARGLAGDREAAFTPGVTSARLRVAGVNVFAAGRTLPEPADREVLLCDDVAGNYKQLVLRDRVLVGVTLVGDLSAMPAAGDVLARRTKVMDRRALLCAGGDGMGPPGADLRSEAVVCACSGTTKAAIVAAIETGCTTVDRIRRETGATLSCGSCSPVLEGLLQAAGPR